MKGVTALKKKKWLIAAVVLLAMFVLSGAPHFLSMMLSTSTYTKVIETNWGIDLPEDGAKEVYSFSEPSFHGDGIRYHVIDYPAGNESKKIQNAMFQIEKVFSEADVPSQGQIAAVEEILKDIDIPDDVIPDWSKCQLVYMKQHDNSELYLFYWSGTGTIYVVESFF